MSIFDGVGYLAFGLALLATCMRGMIPLRIVALCSNVAFLAYGLALDLTPVTVLHLALLPINAGRLWQAARLRSLIRGMSNIAAILDALAPVMVRRTFNAGDILFSRGRASRELHYILDGTVALREPNVRLGKGDVVGGEFLVWPGISHRMTAMCATNVTLLSVDDRQLAVVCERFPEFGFRMVQLVGHQLFDHAVVAAIGSPPNRRRADIARSPTLEIPIAPNAGMTTTRHGVTSLIKTAV